MWLHAISTPKSDAKVPSTVGFSLATERHDTVAEVAILAAPRGLSLQGAPKARGETK
jgi:hypothetical protein